MRCTKRGRAGTRSGIEENAGRLRIARIAANAANRANRVNRGSAKNAGRGRSGKSARPKRAGASVAKVARSQTVRHARTRAAVANRMIVDGVEAGIAAGARNRAVNNGGVKMSPEDRRRRHPGRRAKCGKNVHHARIVHRDRTARRGRIVRRGQQPSLPNRLLGVSTIPVICPRPRLMRCR